MKNKGKSWTDVKHTQLILSTSQILTSCCCFRDGKYNPGLYSPFSSNQMLQSTLWKTKQARK